MLGIACMLAVWLIPGVARLANAGGSAGLMLGLLVECPAAAKRTLQAHDKQLLVFALISYRSVQKTYVFVMVSDRSVRKT